MPSDQGLPRGLVETLGVYQVDPAGGEERRIGAVEYAVGNGLLTMIDADADFVVRLRNVVTAINRKARIVELVPSDAPDAERHAVMSKVTTRDDPVFFDALGGYLERYYGLRLG